MSEDELVKLQELCDSAVYSNEENMLRLGNKAYFAIPVLIAEIRRLRDEPRFTVTRSKWQPNPIAD